MSTAQGGEWLAEALEALPVAVLVVDGEDVLSLANGRARDLLAVEAGDRAPDYLEEAVAGARDGRTIWETRDVPGTRGARVIGEIRAASVGETVVCTVEDLTERARRDRADHEFITNAAHQLRTPITAIATAIEVLQGGAKLAPEPRDRFLGHIERQTERLVRLVRAMLTLSRAERGDVGPLLGLVPLRPMLAGLIEELPPSRVVEVELECQATAAAVADEALLSEALANLITNAVEHAGVGTVRVVVHSSDAATVRIEVVDAGPGIEPGELDRVFERFHRGANAKDGAGLGLPIAKAAIEAQGGTLVLESTPGRGTTASVTLPAR
jgi:signal transduction histidine kinase